MAQAANRYLSARQAAEATAQLLRHDWVVAIVTALSAGPRRFTELQNEINAVDDQAGRDLHPSAITNRTLTNTLNRLTDEHVITRHETPGQPIPVVTYELTTDGYALIPLLDTMAQWQRHRRATPAQLTEPASLTAGA